MSSATLRDFRLSLRSAGLDYLRTLDRAPSEPVEVVADDPELRVDMRLMLIPQGHGAAAVKPEPSPLVPLFFSPIELAAVHVIAREGPCKRAVLGDRTRSQDKYGGPSGKLNSALANLCERGVLVCEDAGYRLTEDGEAVYRAFFAAPDDKA